MTATATVRLSPEIKQFITLASGDTVAASLFKGLEQTAQLKDDSVPPISKAVVSEITLTAGAVTIDFTALTGANGAAVDATGLKLQYIAIINKAANAALSIVAGATNGYSLGHASARYDLPGHASNTSWIQQKFNDDLADVAAGAKTLDVTGTGTQSFYIALLFG